MRFWRTWQMVTVCAVLAVAGLLGWRYLPGPPTKHLDREGPLSASSGHGGSMLMEMDGTWYEAWGSNFLCLHEPGDPVTLTRVRHDVAVEPLELRTFVRTVTPEHLAEAGREDVVIGSARYRRPEARVRLFQGTFSERVAGTVVEQPCSARVDTESGMLHEGFSELVFEMKVGRRGAHVPRTYVDYTRGGREYTLEMGWEMGACGTRTRGVVDRGCS